MKRRQLGVVIVARRIGMQLLLGIYLGGCAASLATGINAGTETLNSIDNFRVEIFQRRVELRQDNRELEDLLIDMYKAAATQASVEGDVKAAEKSVAAAQSVVDAAYPDIVSLIQEVEKIDQAIKEARKQ